MLRQSAKPLSHSLFGGVKVCNEIACHGICSVTLAIDTAIAHAPAITESDQLYAPMPPLRAVLRKCAPRNAKVAHPARVSANELRLVLII